MRPTIDRLTQQHRRKFAGERLRTDTHDTKSGAQAVAASSDAKARMWRAHIDKIAAAAREQRGTP